VIHSIRTLDAHVGGQPLRLVVEGLPRPAGRSLLQKRESLRKQADFVRKAIVREPRGHSDMVAALLTEPVSPEAHAGLIFMDGDGYPAMSGHGVIAVTTLAVERELFFARPDDAADVRMVFDTPAGTVHARARCEARAGRRRVDAVSFTNVPSFVHTPAHPVRLRTRDVRVDIAFGGAFFAIADTEAIGIPLRSERVTDLRRLGADIQDSLNAAFQVDHPLERALGGVAGVIFTGPPEDPEAHLRSVVVSGGLVDRSPGGTATSAVMAVLDAMGLLPGDQTFVHESLTGTLFRGRVARRSLVGDLPALVPEIEGSAWVTGEHTFLLDEDDPFREGFTF
jgi:proline racemase